MLATLSRDYAFSPADKFLHQSSMSFDLSVVQIFSALAAGATVCVAAWETRKDPSELAAFMSRENVSVTYFTPTQFSLLMELNPDALKNCSSYRVAFFAGERLPVRVARGFYDLGTPATLYNTWSPSELVVQTAIAKIDPPAESDISLPIGFPMDNCRHYLLDTKGNPVPVGQIGELVVGGAQVGAGYLNRPDINAKSFVTNPFASKQDIQRGWTRMFKTGDRGRFRPDGQLEFHGRIAGDKQIKLRGFRVDLGEVEQALFKESQSTGKGRGLVDVAVVARSVDGDEQKLVAYLVPKTPIAGDDRVAVASQLHRRVKAFLNDYMLPSGYHFLASLPVTIGGKVDRRDLLTRPLDLVHPSSKPPKPTTGTDLEASVLALFRGTLGSDISVDDSFFERGGNSILLVRLQAKIKKQFKLAPPLPALIREPTAAAVCAFIRRAKGDDGSGKKRGFENVISWAVEANLPNTSQYIPRYGIPRVDRDELDTFLLTGGDSFVGLHLLSEILLSKPSASVHVLGSTSPLQLPAIIDLLDKYNLFGKLTRDAITSRVHCVPGTLDQTNFGLSKSAFRQLGEKVQAIYHLGGHVSLLKTYSSLKPVNVTPIFDIIRLSGIGSRLSDIHYLSTWSVPHLQTWTGCKRTRAEYATSEEDARHFEPPTEDEAGYFKTRWVAENILGKAAERGFPVTITRASNLTSAEGGNGALDAGDEFTMRIALSMIESRTVPQIGTADQPSFALDVIPVDWLAANFFAITTEKAALSSVPASELYTSTRMYHITNPRPLQLKDLAQVVGDIRADHQPAQLVSLDDWIRGLEAAGEGEAGETVRNEVIRQYLSTGYVMFSLENRETMEILETLSPNVEERCPAVDAKLLGDLWRRVKGMDV